MSVSQGIIFSTINAYENKCRFCYSYTPPGPIDNCCQPPTCNSNDITITSSLSIVVNNSTRLTERSLLLGSQQQYFAEQAYQAVTSSVNYTLQNSTSITSTLYGQLLQVQREKYLPYQPYMPEVIPPSVLQFQMNTVNAGVPHSFFTCSDRKGVQFVTT